ncbi:MotA/TolQ/ExbB proton channel family protein [Methanococcus maripaludis]|uniref:Biopolymer transport protein ExbB/TolQ n=1 Tax=Methanococcus maripaludis TaxID=39152 RepID=A0A7J9RZW6_METMI|nr:MotA/TolQ/ExbB proton channel family protein [Methanococcus maripaludis]MBB6067579.1 biopolymer transport protein ExbB/TolQ [Methanococcus maripaludis]MBM7408467.1 biopolymer transport protein ExbB/TolQ [Methanococcus maripaludis]MBP2220225.1 biopolymer transport protein ExbB/TolQ [Methanococcus maripaludis]
MVAIPGSELLSTTLHIISQSLLLPVVAFLLLFMAYAVINFGEFMAEYSSRVRVNSKDLKNIINTLPDKNAGEISSLISEMRLNRTHIEIIKELCEEECKDLKMVESHARNLIEREELRLEKTLEKTDFVTRLGPTLGLMGTLIPMGPGLAALGAGDIHSLANAIIIAFDTTVVGLAAGGICYVISKVRRRWYEEQMSTLDVLMESVLEALKKC